MSAETLGKFVILGKDYPFPHPNTLKFAEAHFIKQTTGGMSLGEAARGLSTGDADALMAFCLVSMRRAGSKVTVEEFMDLGLSEVEYVAQEADPEEDPPVPAADADAAAHTAA